ncbi:Cd(II)/Pb(II)-responsive transcriptional regulator [Atopomonas sediminilitoris]|uniref:Cd(II)/Pb(II)-responsive transcriptional regulator n=1 Tax=Atopomonas sediminilitoris TaxID=2919919 RepID=UPI001F4D395B|nr:Cd(II)/Pb(II)-responsive transcriptional regulator [Atopomonas sediminilitoris]MCJ8168902.1 Cd(II)/Pb(II)-responsive transcriptional regulator [Atopomonas sediminilitoris]
MKIGELAQQTGCSVETIRYYEKAGLLPQAPRSAGNYRQYPAQHIEQLRFIRNCRALDMTHEEIRTLLASRSAPEQTCSSVNQVIDQHLEHIAERIALLQHLQRDLLHLRAQCPQAGRSADCAILQELAEDTSQKQPASSHVPGSH